MASADGMQTVVIESPQLRATFVPGAGMVCSSLCHDGAELLAQCNGVRAYAERGSTMGIPLLYPWANRLAGLRCRAGSAWPAMSALALVGALARRNIASRRR